MHAVAIKEPTAASFRPVGGHNVLVVGQHDESSLALMGSMLISLATQYKPDGAKFFILDSNYDQRRNPNPSTA